MRSNSGALSQEIESYERLLEGEGKSAEDWGKPLDGHTSPGGSDGRTGEDAECELSLMGLLRRLAAERGNPFVADRTEMMVATGRMPGAVWGMLTRLEARGQVRLGKRRGRRVIELLGGPVIRGGVGSCDS